MTNSSPSLRQAAVWIRSLDVEAAATLLAQLSPREAKALRQAVRELGQVDPQEQEQLRRALQQQQATTAISPANPQTQPRRESDNGVTGVELNFSLPSVEPIHSAPLPAEMPAPEEAPPLHKQPFSWLEQADLPSLASMLQQENISTVALVLSYLPPAQGSALLAAMPAPRQAAALERLATLGDTAPAAVEVIEQGLAEWITQQKQEQQQHNSRIEVIQAIWQHIEKSTRTAVLVDLASRNRELADRLAPLPVTANDQVASAEVAHPTTTRTPPVIAKQAASLAASSREEEWPASLTKGSPIALKQSLWERSTPRPAPIRPLLPPAIDFEDLVQLTREELAWLFRECDTECLVLALAGGSDAVAAHLASQLPRSVAEELWRRIHSLSAIRLTDVTRAQQRVCQLAGQLQAFRVDKAPEMAPATPQHSRQF